MQIPIIGPKFEFYLLTIGAIIEHQHHEIFEIVKMTVEQPKEWSKKKHPVHA